jgi:PqqD family protein of HPr-rel-A system
MLAAQKANLRIEWTGREATVVDEQRGTTHALNATAAAVLELCDGNASVAKIARQLAADTGEQRNELLVEQAIEDLARAGLVDIEKSQAEEPMTRRKLISAAGAVAAAVVVVPVVGGMMRPSSARAEGGAPPPWTKPPQTTTPRPTPTRTPHPTTTPSFTTPPPTTPAYTTPPPTTAPPQTTCAPDSPQECIKSLARKVRRLMRTRVIDRKLGGALLLQLRLASWTLRGRHHHKACRFLDRFIAIVHHAVDANSCSNGTGADLIYQAKHCKRILGCGRSKPDRRKRRSRKR